MRPASAAPHPTPPAADWPPFETVIFDCDSTLAAVEGIDELARWAGRQAEVAALTRRAMDGELPLEQVYSQRLELLTPSREHVRRLSQLYQETVIPDAPAVIQALQAAGRQVFIVSGGLAEGVRAFGVWLGLPEAHVQAVEVEYNQLAGRWWEAWKHPGGRNPDERYLAHDGGPLTIGQGKAEVIRRLRRGRRGRALLVGDGVSDLEAGAAVDLFVGFGGVADRERVRAGAPVFVPVAELAPVLPLALARPDAPPAHQALYARGVELIRTGQIAFQEPAAREGLLRRLGGG
jgi:phosphoserine phosphatase